MDKHLDLITISFTNLTLDGEISWFLYKFYSLLVLIDKRSQDVDKSHQARIYLHPNRKLGDKTDILLVACYKSYKIRYFHRKIYNAHPHSLVGKIHHHSEKLYRLYLYHHYYQGSEQDHYQRESSPCSSNTNRSFHTCFSCIKDLKHFNYLLFMIHGLMTFYKIVIKAFIDQNSIVKQIQKRSVLSFQTLKFRLRTIPSLSLKERSERNAWEMKP